MNKIILIALLVGTAVAQYPSPDYLPANRGPSDVSSAYSQRGGQYANGPGGYGLRNGAFAGYSNANAGSYSSSSSNTGSYSSINAGTSGYNGGNGGYSGIKSDPASRGYASGNQGSLGRVGPSAYNGGASGYNGAGSGYNGGAAGLNAAGYNNAIAANRGAGPYNGGAAGYNGGAAGYNRGASPYNGGRGAYNGQDDLSEPAKYEFKYDVFAPEFGNEFGHAEQRDGDYTSGSYYVLLPDGRRQLVEYTADQEGYKPRISYTEAASGAGAYNSAGPGGYNGPRGQYNGQGGAYNGQGAAYNGQGAAYNGPIGQIPFNGGRSGAYGNGNGFARGPAYPAPQASSGSYTSSGSQGGGY